MAIDSRRRGILCIVSGPSGSGKTTLCRSFTRIDSECAYAVSCTTRRPREGEVDGRDYHFLNREDFEERATNGELLEWAEVHGNLYGTLRSSVLAHLHAGTDVLMDIDVQGAALVRKNADPAVREALVDIFVMPPDRGELERRLGGRGTESAEELALRLHNALEEMGHWRAYTYAILSGTPEQDLERFRSIILGERCRTRRLRLDDEPPPAQPELFAPKNA